MQILYDGSIFCGDHPGGIRRYFTNLISRLPADDELWVTTTHRPGPHFPSHINLHVRRFPRFRPNRISAVFERQYFRSVERRQKFDVAHPTYYGLLTGGRLRDYDCPTVITVYDMIGELFAGDTAAERIATENKRRAVDDAQRIIGISQNTKSDLIKLWGVPAGKIQVIYLASELDLSMVDEQAQVPEEPYFLYVGSHQWPYKNFDGVLNSLAHVVAQHRTVRLCVAGPPLTTQQRVTIDTLRLSDHILHYGRPNDGQLSKLYQRSVALVYPSLYEGFGIPPLEAMACGTAVIAVNRSSIPEVVGDAALLVNPESPEDLTSAMISLLENQTQREELVHRGQQRAKQFSWDRMAAEIREVYEEVAGKH